MMSSYSHVGNIQDVGNQIAVKWNDKSIQLFPAFVQRMPGTNGDRRTIRISAMGILGQQTNYEDSYSWMDQDNATYSSVQLNCFSLGYFMKWVDIIRASYDAWM